MLCSCLSSMLWLYRSHNGIYTERPVLQPPEKQIDEQVQAEQVRSGCKP